MSSVREEDGRSSPVFAPSNPRGEEEEEATKDKGQNSGRQHKRHQGFIRGTRNEFYPLLIDWERWDDLEEIIKKIDIDDKIFMKLLGMTEEDMSSLDHLPSAKWPVLCRCLFTRMAQKVEIAFKSHDEESDMRVLYNKIRRMTSNDELGEIESIMEGMHVTADRDADIMKTCYEGVTFNDMLTVAYLFVHATNEDVRATIQRAEMIETLHVIRKEKLIDSIFDRALALETANWLSPLVVVSRATNTRESFGVYPETIFPFMTLMLRRCLTMGIIHPHGWAVQSFMSDNFLEMNEPIPVDVLLNLKKSYRNLDTGVSKVIYMFKVVLPSYYKTADNRMDDARFLGVMILRKKSGVYITALDKYWASSMFPQVQPLQGCYMNFLAEIGKGMGLKKFNLVVPNFFFSGNWGAISDVLDPEFFENLTFGSNNEYIFECMDLHIELTFRPDEPIFKEYPWLYKTLNNPLSYPASVSKNPRHTHDTDGIRKTIEEDRSRAWVAQLYDPLMYVLICLSGPSVGDDGLNNFVSKMVFDVQNGIDQVNAHLIACILCGSFLLPPCVVQALISKKSLSETMFYMIDGEDNYPPDVYAWAISQKGGAVEIRTLNYDLKQYEDDIFDIEFSTEKIDFDPDPNKPISFLRFLKKESRKKSPQIKPKGRSRPDTDRHEDSRRAKGGSSRASDE